MAMLLTRRAMLASTAIAMPTMAVARGTGARRTGIAQDPRAPIAERVKDLLGQMTLDEKVAQMRCMWSGKSAMWDKGRFSPGNAARVFANGIGQIARPNDTVGMGASAPGPFLSIEDGIGFANAVQRQLVEHTRLGIPALFHEEAAHGYMAAGATIFPIPPALASTWDPSLVEQAFTVAAREARARGVTVVLAPVLDLARDPRYGRVEEFFGEDPVLVAQIGVEVVRGLQGRLRPLAHDRVFATLKHFVHAVPQGGLNIAPADISERSLRENFLVPFARAISEADPALIMPSYNEIGGVPSHANGELLQAVGRQRLGFKGAYFSDYGAIAYLAYQHHVAANEADAAVLAINAGVDADLPDGSAYAHLGELVRSGRVAEAQIELSVSRILAMKFEAGLFEAPYADTAAAHRQTNTPADIALARRVAQKSVVLLTNDGVLPLDAQADLHLAVIGPNAAEPLFGGYSGINDKAVGILDGITAAIGPRITLSYAQGVEIVGPAETHEHPDATSLAAAAQHSTALIAQAADLAKRADVIVLAVGDRPEITREAVAYSLPGDRATLGLYGQQDALVDALLATGKPIVALLLNGRALAVNRLAEKANALVECWYPGQEGGHAIADVIFGLVNPGGKLPVSFPRAVGELPVFYNRHPSADINRYVEEPRRALFPFGHGLSYTTFVVSAPRVGRTTFATHETVAVEIDVTNTGHREGDEVVQLYIRDDVSSVPRPVLELRKFARVTLRPAETRTLHFELTHDDLAFWDIAMNWTVEPGSFTIHAGNSSESLKSVQIEFKAQ